MQSFGGSSFLDIQSIISRHRILVQSNESLKAAQDQRLNEAEQLRNQLSQLNKQQFSQSLSMTNQISRLSSQWESVSRKNERETDDLDESRSASVHRRQRLVEVLQAIDNLMARCSSASTMSIYLHQHQQQQQKSESTTLNASTRSTMSSTSSVSVQKDDLPSTELGDRVRTASKNLTIFSLVLQDLQAVVDELKSSF